MGFSLTQQKIKSLCGQISYIRGETYYRAEKVSIYHYDPENSSYLATVKGSGGGFQVTVEFGKNGELGAKCSCPALSSYDKYCQHIAAALLTIRDRQQDGISEGVPARHIEEDDNQLANSMLELFSEKPPGTRSNSYFFDSRIPLEVEFTCIPLPYVDRKNMFGLEMKVGPKRLYNVKKIRDFLDRINRREAFLFTTHFTYDPKLHYFQKENEAVIRQLIEIYHNEKMYHEVSDIESTTGKNNERILFIPPFFWEALHPLLTQVPSVKLKAGELTYDGLQLSDDNIPLHFSFDQAEEKGYQLEVQGLEKLIVMEPYGVILSEGKLIKLQADQCKRVADLKQMLEPSRRQQIPIPQEQMAPFMEKVLPGLMKLGKIHIAQAVSDRIMQTPLKAKLYLDRVKDRLLAGLEFHYGSIVVNPLENGEKRSSDRILMRDGEKERQILELMERSLFMKTEGGYFMHDEEAQYDFLYHMVPQLEKLVSIYATTAVKLRLHSEHTSPKVTVDVTERIDWLEFRFEMEGIPDSEIRNVLESLEEKRKYYRLPNGSLLPLETAEFQEIARLMNEMGIREAGAQIQLPVVQGLQLIDSEKKGNAVTFGRSLRRLLENMRNPDNLDFPVPESLRPILRDYQKYGYQWLKTLAHYGFGGILADDMGLGKTLQSIAFIVSVLPEMRVHEHPVLIVCPASLVYNWRNELKKFAPEIRTVIADGSKAERSRVLKKTAEVDVIITSYPLLRRDIEWYDEQTFHTLILDEAQQFKNYTTQTAKAVKQLRAHHRFALSGTPVENNLEELWSIFDVVFPTLFESRKAFHELSRALVAKRVRPFLLRRLKSDVLKELPDKIESLQTSELLPEQKKLYVAYLAELQQETVKHLHQGFQKNRIKILAGLTRLRQLCCHPSLFVEGYKGSSAKFEQLMELLAECRKAGRRVLVFSQFTEMLGLIRRELGDQGVAHFYLDGKTANAERVELCNRFNEGERGLFLISLKAGGTGLNLTGADTVILYDLWWNPAVEQQAADRAHRIGQKNVVQVIRLASQGTVEEKMYELQQKKKDLIKEVIGEGQQELSALTEQEIRQILMIGT
ncbi:DEAD/DEAH box helicase [Ammoniphilus resinae]|uniref:ERCC4-related helicase n=1 Tax=Ammoniphilus resinae TaxID=861532 RepID=A0ABS4GVL4_9BACL|nr:DEAD/DEAH box helicase [Ammoniphilus resinae]MBP1934318.1 ERCC4-related helicase [Ammoniphilus resinae]